MVGHLLAYHPALVALKQLCEAGDLGEIRYVYSQRLNLGRLRADENALWSLGAHDVSAILALTGELPAEVSARGQSYVRDGVEDVVFAHLAFADGARRPHPRLLARPPQGAPPHRGRLAADGDFRRHGPRAHADHLRQGV